MLLSLALCAGVISAAVAHANRIVVVQPGETLDSLQHATCQPAFRGSSPLGHSFWSIASNCSVGDSFTSLEARPDRTLVAVTLTSLDNGAVVPLDWKSDTLHHFERLYERMQSPSIRGAQHVFASTALPDSVVISDNLLLVNLPREHLSIVDMLFTPYVTLTTIAEHNLSQSHPVQAQTAEDEDRLKPYFPIKYNATLDHHLLAITQANLQNDVTFLSGEHPNSTIRSRHSFSSDVHKAAAWLKAQYEAAGLECVFHQFAEGFAPNVVCELAPPTSSLEADQVVVIGAHYDSRGDFGFVAAPGADDDGSGSAALLNIAKALHVNKNVFKKRVVLAAFAGEEQGLVGSRALAKKFREQGTDIFLMIQMDMLAYRKPGEPLQLAFPDLIGSVVARELMANISSVYQPQLQVGLTPACCSDHQTFKEEGFTSTWVFERHGPIADPKYHNSLDLSDRVGYDFEQLEAIARVVYATLLHVA